MKHIDEGTIHAWLDGALEDAQARDVESHVAACAQCAERVAEARGLVAGASRILGALDDVPGGVLPAGTRAAPPSRVEQGRARRSWVAAPWVTGIAAVLVFAIVLRTSDEVAQSESTTQRAAAAAMDSVKGMIQAPAEDLQGALKTTPAVAGPSTYEAAAPARSGAGASRPTISAPDGRTGNVASGAGGERTATERQQFRERAVEQRSALAATAAPAPSVGRGMVAEQPSAPPPVAAAADQSALRAESAQKAADEIVVTGSVAPSARALAGCYVVALLERQGQDAATGDRAPAVTKSEPARRLAGRAAASAGPPSQPAAVSSATADRLDIRNAMQLALTLVSRDSGFVARSVVGDSVVGVWKVINAESAEVRLTSGVRVVVPRAIRSECP